jgi:hypothetical protein
VVEVRLRVLLLIANFAANAVLLYGAAGYVADGSRLFLVFVGGATTLLCIVLLSRPTEGSPR